MLFWDGWSLGSIFHKSSDLWIKQDAMELSNHSLPFKLYIWEPLIQPENNWEKEAVTRKEKHIPSPMPQKTSHTQNQKIPPFFYTPCTPHIDLNKAYHLPSHLPRLQSRSPTEERRVRNEICRFSSCIHAKHRRASLHLARSLTEAWPFRWARWGGGLGLKMWSFL